MFELKETSFDIVIPMRWIRKSKNLKELGIEASKKKYMPVPHMFTKVLRIYPNDLSLISNWFSWTLIIIFKIDAHFGPSWKKRDRRIFFVKPILKFDIGEYQLHRRSELLMTSANIGGLPLVESYLITISIFFFIFIWGSTISVIEKKLEKIVYHKKKIKWD